MTPKQKATKLLNQFKEHDYDWHAQSCEHNVIQYSLITVNEILSLQKMKNNVFWKDVKKELEKMLE